MALASSGWEDYRIGGPVSRSIREPRSSFGLLVVGLLLALAAAAAVPVYYALQTPGFAVPDDSAVIAQPAEPSVPRAAAAPSLLQRNAIHFLRDSLQLTRSCPVGCISVATDVAEALKFGRFAPTGGAVVALPTGLPLQQRFASRIAPETAAPAPTRVITPAPVTVVAPAIAPSLMAAPTAVPAPAPAAPTAASAPIPAIAPAPIRIAPTVVVPLVPVPAPRLQRPAADTVPAAASGAPLEEASLPPLAKQPVPGLGPFAGRGDGVAVYDISAATVYLPDGQRLEAHSGLGYMVDNPRYADQKNSGPTPPNTYKLVRLENRFFGVEALRLVPADGYNKYGRDGLLTHTYLLRGRPAQSNGCVAFKDYDRFLAAFKRGEFDRLVVVASLASPSMALASAGG